MSTLREALGAAIDGDTIDSTPAQVQAVETPSTSVDTSVDASPAGSLYADVPTTKDIGKSAESIRDGLGRFVAKAAEAPGATPAAPSTPSATPAPADAPVPVPAPPAAESATPPVSWKPEVKAEWANLPPTVQAEVARREVEMARAMTENASARSIATQFTETITPYVAFMRAEGATSPLDAIRNVFDTVVQLRTGSPFQKAQTIARLIEAYGVDIEALDSTLVGKAQEDPQVQMQREIEQRVQAQMAPFQQIINQAQQAQQAQNAALGQQVDAELTAFKQSRPHYETVRVLMADMMESAARNNFDLSMADAYDQALRLHPATKNATIAGQTAQTAQQLNEAAQRAKRAAVGARVPAQSSSVPAGGSGAAPSTLRGAIMNAMQDVPLA